ncbi:hypothetical protein AX16_005763 [Volvariella volvacea WC 439]|nr:hypothetical protein AX16_005763 [Volvariella volvacea WC 439]
MPHDRASSEGCPLLAGVGGKPEADPSRHAYFWIRWGALLLTVSPSPQPPPGPFAGVPMAYSQHGRTSVDSQANSSYTYEYTPSTRHFLSDTDMTSSPNPGSQPRFQPGSELPSRTNSPLRHSSTPPDPPPLSFRSELSHGHQRKGSDEHNQADVSLATHYLPSKFSSTMLNSSQTGPGTGPRKRKPHYSKASSRGPEPRIPKQGGGVDAFRSGAPRIPGRNDELDFGEPEPWLATKPGASPTRRPKKLRWNRFKWTLFATNTLLTAYSLTALVFCLLTWFNTFHHASILLIGNRPELIISTLAASLGLFTALLGWSGILLNNRRFLALYALFTWLTFIFLVVPGYIACRRREYNLEGKLNRQWSRAIDAAGRGTVQSELGCCGYFSPFVEATVTATCYARSTLPGCKLRYLEFERVALRRWYAVVFGLVPAHVVVMVGALLCANHVTYRFGKGMMPKRYRLSVGSVAVLMERYATQLAEQYGLEFANDVLAKSRSTLNLLVPNAGGGGGGGGGRGDSTPSPGSMSRNGSPGPYAYPAQVSDSYPANSGSNSNANSSVGLTAGAQGAQAGGYTPLPQQQQQQQHGHGHSPSKLRHEAFHPSAM